MLMGNYSSPACIYLAIILLWELNDKGISHVE